jgi:hypothetical protein
MVACDFLHFYFASWREESENARVADPMENNPQIASLETESDFTIDGHLDVLYEMFESRLDVPFEELADLPVTLEKMKSAGALCIVLTLITARRQRIFWRDSWVTPKNT